MGKRYVCSGEIVQKIICQVPSETTKVTCEDWISHKL